MQNLVEYWAGVSPWSWVYSPLYWLRYFDEAYYAEGRQVAYVLRGLFTLMYPVCI